MPLVLAVVALPFVSASVDVTSRLHCATMASSLPVATSCRPDKVIQSTATLGSLHVRGGGWIVPAGWNPLGYKITDLGEEYLSYDGALESDVGRFLASLKSGRKRFQTLKEQWLEVLRVSKTAQSMRIYKKLQDLLQFCLKAGLID